MEVKLGRQQSKFPPEKQGVSWVWLESGEEERRDQPARSSVRRNVGLGINHKGPLEDSVSWEGRGLICHLKRSFW